jgi:hypothetical protein
VGRSVTIASPNSSDRIVKDLFRDSLAVLAATHLVTAVGSLVVDPGYSVDYDEGIGRVSNRSPPFLFTAFNLAASFDAVPRKHWFLTQSGWPIAKPTAHVSLSLGRSDSMDSQAAVSRLVVGALYA